MSRPASVSSLGGGPGWTPATTARRSIDAYHTDYARARRPRVSWQALGLQLGVNAEDLRMACEGRDRGVKALAPVLGRSAGPAAPPVKFVAAGTFQVRKISRSNRYGRIVLALAGGVSTHEGLAKAEPDASAGALPVAVSNLRRLGLVAPPDKAFRGRVTLTAEGQRVARDLTASGSGTPSGVTAERETQKGTHR